MCPKNPFSRDTFRRSAGFDFKGDRLFDRVLEGIAGKKAEDN
jgi:hypothetical protein